MDRLRSPGGCPWDAEQTHASLAGYQLEEAHEAVEAIDHGDLEALREEQQRVHSSIESMRGQFVALVEAALARLERPLDGEILLVEDLTSRVSNAAD